MKTGEALADGERFVLEKPDPIKVHAALDALPGQTQRCHVSVETKVDTDGIVIYQSKRDCG